MKVSALLICHLVDRLWLGSAIIADKNDEVPIGSVHGEAFWLLAKGILDLSGIEDFSSGANKFVVSCKTLFLGQSNLCNEHTCSGSSRNL